MLLVERAEQTALMSCISINNWPMFQAPESRERDKFCIRRDGCSYTFAPVLILSQGIRAVEHSTECRERMTKLMLEDACDAARAAEREARFAKKQPSRSGMGIVPRVVWCFSRVGVASGGPNTSLM